MSASDSYSLEKAPEREECVHLPELIREADRDQILRVAHGVYIYPLLLLVVATTTPYRTEHPRIFWSCATAIVIAMLMRLAVLPVRKHLESMARRHVFLLLAANVALASGSLGALHFCGVRFYGLDSWTFSITMLWVAGVACGGTISFTPDFSLMRLHIVLVLGPALASGLWMGGPKGNVFALANILLIAFLILQGHRLNRAYWEQLPNRARDATRARIGIGQTGGRGGQPG